MGVVLLMVVAVVLIGALRINHDIDVHEDILHDAEYEKY
jgi:hypothetical protein